MAAPPANHMQSAHVPKASRFNMVNKYLRKTSNASWDETTMKLAMAEAQKTSVNAAAKKYGINLSTLQRHIKKGCPKKTLGRFKTVFTQTQEAELVEYLFHMDNLFFGLTKTDFLKLVYQYAARNNISHPFKNEVAGEDWYVGFKKRHPNVSLRRPEPTSIARARGFNRPQVERFFNILEAEIDKHNIDASRIYNVDETGIQTTSNKPPRVLCRSGKKQVGIISSVERGKLTTVVCCCNAAGSFIPPFLIFGRKRMVGRLLDGSPPGTAATCTDNGWINGPAFLEWLRHFVDAVRPTSEKKVILVMDNHESHKYLGALEYASQHHVIFVSLAPHTTHRMQPLDTCIYGPLKIYFVQAVVVFQRTYIGRIISQYDVARLFGEAYLKAASVQNAVKGFSCTGIWPTNRNIFDDSDYMPSELTDRPDPSLNLNTAIGNLVSDEPETAIEDVAVVAEDGHSDSDRTISPSVLASIYNTCVTPPLAETEQNEIIPIDNRRVTPMEIRPTPKMQPSKTTRKRKSQRAEVLTSTPIKDQQREKENRRNTFKKSFISEVAGTSKKVTKNDRKKTKRGPKKNKNDETEYRCISCTEVYTDPPAEDWIQCDDCKLWAHEACTSYCGQGSYYCDFCHQ